MYYFHLEPFKTINGALLQKWPVLILCTLFVSFGNEPLHSQSQDPFAIKSMKSNEWVRSEPLFTSSKSSNKQTERNMHRTYDLNMENLSKITADFQALRSIPIPIESDESRPYLFTEYDFFDSNFEVHELTEQESKIIPIHKGIHLKGISKNTSNGFATLSIFDQEIYGMVYDESGTKLSILPMVGEQSHVQRCVFIDERNLNFERLKASCQTDDYVHYLDGEQSFQYRLGDNCKKIGISIDADYDLYVRFNKNPQAVSNYIIGLFNNVHTLYKREGITIMLSQINIHTVEDNFTHLSASSDLESFRKKYSNSSKLVKILLSGFLKNGEATLGGISYINTTCNSSYSYAYANVYGSYLNTPMYSWDVFMVTHELGHVFGSRHTHACVWGPLKNKAIDNCAKLEGSCAPPGIPSKGTIMSYCYLKGMPGIDLLSGFGKEPGDLIRSTIKKASCLSSYIPDNKTLETSNTQITANVECSDGVYTHYYFDNNTASSEDDILLLSIDPKGNEIGHVGDSAFVIQMASTKNYGSGNAYQITAPYVDRNYQFYAGNKFWTLQTLNRIKSPISIRYYLNKTDILELQNTSGTSAVDSFQFYQISNPGNINPETNHENTGKMQFTAFKSSQKPVIGSYTYFLNTNGVYTFELLTNVLQNTGFGSSSPLNTFTKFNTVQAKTSGSQTIINFSTSFENNAQYFVIQRSNDNINFDSVGTVKAIGQSVSVKNYNLTLSRILGSDESIRIKAIGPNKNVLYSPIVNLTNDYTSSSSLSLYPNPVTSGVLFVDYNYLEKQDNIRIQITDAYGRSLMDYSELAVPGLNFYTINTAALNNGLHYLLIYSKSNTIRKSFTVN